MSGTPVFTRADYMASPGPESHRRYYAQFVTPAVRNIVADRIGVERIKASVDRHMNDIPLRLWDALHASIYASCGCLVRKINGTYALSDSVCIAKEAARQIKESS